MAKARLDTAGRLKLLPDGPGVYLMKDRQGRILYVGKARSLRKRLASYFQPSARLDPRIEVMVRQVADFDTIVTDSDVEALVLEANLIKQYRPRYNVRLRDDKKYPFIQVTLAEEFPRLSITRTLKDDGSRYFGPYTDVKALRKTVRLIREVFKLSSCKRDFSRRGRSAQRACLDYDIGRCAGPCTGRVSAEDYRELVRSACLFLDGRRTLLAHQLEKRMASASRKLDYEKAARIRDQLKMIEKVVERQKVASTGGHDQDIVALRQERDTACVSVFMVREGKATGQQHFFLRGVRKAAPAEVLGSFLKQHYLAAGTIPKEIVLPGAPAEGGLIDRWLEARRGGKVRLTVPKRGEKRKLVEMVERNAALRLSESRLRSVRLPGTVSEAVQPARIALPRSLGGRRAHQQRQRALDELGQLLGLAGPPGVIEAFDISNIAGREAVGSMVVFRDGRPEKDAYRRFRIKLARGRDDYAMMAEVLERRYRRALEEDQVLPDLILVDGGAGHLGAAVRVLRRLGIGRVPAVGLAKRRERVFTVGRRGPLLLPADSDALYLLQRVRDEAHRFAIRFHRKVRGGKIRRSVLDAVPGVGMVRKQALLRRFGSVEAVARASPGEIAAVPGVGPVLARVIKESLA